MTYFYRMMRALLFLSIFFTLILACNKEKFITGKNAFIITSDTAIHFDTVFTSVGSVTKQLKIFNVNNQKLLISNLQLAGGATSFFKLNVSGSPGTQFSNIEIDNGDSLYLFVSVNINPDSQQLPFMIEDSIRIDYNGNTQYVKLDAYGQNAHFLRSTIITQNTTWPNDLPYVLMDTFAVSAGATLTIEKGAQIYCHANTPFTVAGSLQINGSADSTGRVKFRSDRLDAPYALQPGTWRGIYFSRGSKNNVLLNTTIENAIRGIGADAGSSVTMEGCIISNCAEVGLITYNSAVNATNCLIENCGSNVVLDAGDRYTFVNCTLAVYSSQYLFHQNAAITLREAGALFQNCIVYGEEGNVKDEIQVDKTNTNFTVAFVNSVYRSPAENPFINYTNCLMNTDPLFQSTDQENNIFNFHLTITSPCIDAGIANNVVSDLDGNKRNGLPDLGCFEFH